MTKRIIEGVHLAPMGNANAFLIEDADELTLVDAGYPGKEMAAIRAIGRSPDELKHVVFTHHHMDHIGSGAAIVRLTGAKTYMHTAGIAIAETGGPFRPLKPSPGLLGHLMLALFYDQNRMVEPVTIDQSVRDGDLLPLGGGLEVIHTPGHCSGNVSLLLRRGSMLLVGDACMNIMGLGDPVGCENLGKGRASQRRLADLEFDVAAFGHGSPIVGGASNRFRKKWGRSNTVAPPQVPIEHSL